MDISKIFEDENLKYYIHGTGRSGNDTDNSITTSIFKNGLLLDTGSYGYNEGSKNIGSTSYPIGFGSPDLYRESAHDALNHNRHLESKRTIIIALPKNYIFPDYFCFNDMKEAAFTEKKAFYISNDDKELFTEPPLYDVLMSEFIVGAYDAITQTFIPNENYFKNSNKNGRESAFKKVHENYLHYLKQQIYNVNINSDFSFTIDDYLALFDEKSKYKMPLSAEEIQELKTYEQEVLRQKEQQSASSQSTQEEDFFGWDGMWL